MSVTITVTAKGNGTIEVWRQGAFVESVPTGGSIPFSFEIGDAFSFVGHPAQGEKFVKWDNRAGLTSTDNPLAGNITSGGVLVGEFTGGMDIVKTLALLLGLVVVVSMIGGKR